MNSTTTVIIGATATRSKNQQTGCILCHPSMPVTVVPGIFIFISAGMNFALGLGWDEYSVYASLQHFRFSWFIGMIAGTIISLPLGHFIPKKFIMLVSSLLILAEGIIFTSAPYNSDALLVGRYLNGLAAGLASITFLVHASEICNKSYRGACLGLEQYSLTFGIAIQMIYASQWGPTTTFPANRLHGILDIIFSVIATGNLYFFVESPLDYLRKGDEAAARDAVLCVQFPRVSEAALKNRLEKMKDYVRQQENLSWIEGLKRGALPLVKMIFFRSMMLAFTFSLPLSTALQYSILVNGSIWPPVVAACLRVLGCFIGHLQVDFLGRKIASLVSMAMLGALIVAIGSICSYYLNIFEEYPMSVVTSLCLLIQFFAGFFAPFTSAYVGEAFPLKVKPYLMTICVVVEQIIHIIVICTFSFINAGVFLGPGIMILIVFLVMCVTMPETKKTTLEEAQERMRQLVQFKMY